MGTIQKRVGRDGSPVYRTRVRIKGAPTASATFSRLTDAKKWIQNTEADIRNGRHFKTSRAKKYTLGQIIDRYLKTILAKKERDQSTRTQELNWWKSQIGAYLLSDITPNLISENREKLREGKTQKKTPRSNATVNRYLAALSHVFTVAINEWELLDINPLTRVRKEQEPRGRVRFLNDEERNHFLAACKESGSEALYPAVVLALSTGMRQGELFGLTWNDLDLNRGRIILQQTKNGERRGVPLTNLALELLRARSRIRRLDTCLIFPSPNDPAKPINLQKAFKRAMSNAKTEDFRWHDLRHCTASYLAMNGASLAEIAEVLGHKTLVMARRYSHLSDSHTSKIVESMNKRIFG